MTVKSLVAILFTLIVAVEIFFYFQTEVPVKEVANTKSTSQWDKTTTELDNAKQADTSKKYMVIIFATVAMGAIVTFSVPNKKLNITL